MKPFNRRAFLTSAIAPAGLSLLPGTTRAAGPVPQAGGSDLLELRFGRGEPVPGWIQRATHPAFFGVDVRWAFGRRIALERAYADYPRRRPLNDKIELGIYLAPLSPLRPGDCMVRYRGGRRVVNGRYTFQIDMKRGVGLGYVPPSPSMHIWVYDGEDLLSNAIPGPEHEAMPRLCRDRELRAA